MHKRFAFRRDWGPKPKYDRVLNYDPGQSNFIVIAGPCSVESEEQINRVADHVAKYGATHLRGGLFRAGTYPGGNFGLVDESLVKAFWRAAHSNGLKTVIEVLDYRYEALQTVSPYADCLQVGCRQMQNYTLLRLLGSTGKTIFLKRNPGATLDEWLGAADHLLAGGNCHPVLIERGSNTNSKHVRWDLSISMIPAVKAITKMPIIIDAAHGTGRRDLVEPMTLAGIAAGADGLLAEVHPEPDQSLSDADQAIDPESFNTLMSKVNGVRHALRSV